MTALLRPRLRSGRSSAIDTMWDGTGVEQAARMVSDGLFGRAEVLPLTVFAGARGFPVVTWNTAAHLPRACTSEAPAVALRPAQATEGVALSIVAFIGVGHPAKVRMELAGVRAITRTVVMMPLATRWKGLALAEFDAQGTAVVVSDAATCEVLVGGDAGPRPGSALAPAWRQAFEAQLADWSASHRRLP